MTTTTPSTTTPATVATVLRRAFTTAASGALLAVGVSACAALPQAPEPLPQGTEAGILAPADAILADYGLDGLEVREVIDTLDAMPLGDRPQELMASVRPDELVLTDSAGTKDAIPMPENEFYVAIAPYIDTTHECYFHSLTTCTAELQGESVDVVVTDTVTGQVLIDGAMTTFDNGFVGLWLPRDLQAEITIKYDGLSATSALSTQATDDATCITTMQLS